MHVIGQIVPAFTHPGAFRLTQAGGIFSGIAAAEMGIRAVGNLFLELTGKGDKDNLENFSKNLGGAILYAGLGLNIIPGTAILGGAILASYSIYTSGRELKDSYLFSFLTGGLLNRGLNLLEPVIKKVWNVVSEIIWGLGRVLGKVLNLVIPRHPIWIGVCALATAIVLYKGPIVIYRLITSGGNITF